MNHELLRTVKGELRTTVVLGAAGQLGRELCSRLTGQVVPLARANLELSDAAAVRDTLGRLRPDIVINCAAYNFVDKAEDEPERALLVNTFAVRGLADVCRDLNALLVHFSTDYVFGIDAARRTPYRESDKPGPISIYGFSKYAGECSVRSLCPRHVVIRTCGLYGRWGSGGKGGNFVETMLQLASRGKPIKVVQDQVCTPSYAADLADATIQLLETSTPSGLYHLTNAGACSWYEFAAAIFELAGMKAALSPTTSKEYASRAARPAYSVLASERPETPSLRPWREALAAYLDERRRSTVEPERHKGE